VTDLSSRRLASLRAILMQSDAELRAHLPEYFLTYYKHLNILRNPARIEHVFQKGREMHDYLEAEGKDVLDLGAGFGIEALLVAIYGARKVIATEIDHDMVAVGTYLAKAIDPPVEHFESRYGDGIGMEFPNASFDGVMANCVISHVRDLEGFLREAHRLLRATPLRFAGNVEARDVYSGAADVVVRREPPDDTPFGARLRRLVAELRPAGLVVLGAGALPLATAADRRAFVAAAAAELPGALANQRHSADAIAIACARDTLRDLPDLTSDNALPRWLAEVAGVPVRDLAGRRHLAVDVDSPLDLLLLEAARGAPALPLLGDAEARPVRARLAALRGVARDPSAEIMVAGRTSAADLRWLERGTRSRTRALIEERGLRTASAGAMLGRPNRRAPHSILGELLDRDGPESLGRHIAALADGALLDSRVLLAHRLGAKSRLVNLISAAICGLALFFGASLISYFPKPVLGGMLLYLGLSFLVDWLIDARRSLPLLDYLLVWVILFIIASVGFLEGIAAGIFIAAILFVISYSRLNVVKSTLDGSIYHSKVDRPKIHRDMLHEHGSEIFIMSLQGFIFFGTVQNVLERHPMVASFCDAPETHLGATVAVLRPR